jgi:epoxyqueuosine reductase
MIPGVIAPFARFNYYREALKRMKGLSNLVRARYGGKKSDYRILCNSPVPEKPLAVACGLGAPGRNGLVISRESGSLFVIAAMTLPYSLETDPPLGSLTPAANRDGEAARFPLCGNCCRAGLTPPCVAACPTGAALGNGRINLERCIQWYASGHGAEIPKPVLAVWGKRLYGCASCQDACIHNTRPIQGVQTDEGPLPEFIDVRTLLKLSDAEINAMFKGTAMGLSWLGPRAIRRNAEAVLQGALYPQILPPY